MGVVRLSNAWEKPVRAALAWGDVLDASVGSFPTSRTDTYISHIRTPHSAATAGSAWNPFRSRQISLPKLVMYGGKENKNFFSKTNGFLENLGTQSCRP